MVRLTALLSVLVIIGCAGDRNGGGMDQFSLKTISGIDWQLVRLDMAASEMKPAGDTLITFSCTPDGEVTGVASINRYSGNMETDGDRILRWSPFRVTRMAGPPDLMRQEDQFIRALPQTTRFYPFGEKLVFENQARGVRLEFAPLSE